MVAYLPFDLLPDFNTVVSAVVLDCFLEVCYLCYLIIAIVTFLYYWEAVEQEGDPEATGGFSAI